MITFTWHELSKPYFTFEGLMDYAPGIFQCTAIKASKYNNYGRLGMYEREDMEQECALLAIQIIESVNTGNGYGGRSIKTYKELKKYVSYRVRIRMLQIRYDEYGKPNGKLNNNADDINEEFVQMLSSGNVAGIETVEQIDNRLYHQKRLQLWLDKVKKIQTKCLKDIIYKILKLYEDIPLKLLMEMQRKSQFGHCTQIKFTIPLVAEYMEIFLPCLKKVYSIMVELYINLMEEAEEGEQVNLAINMDYDGTPSIVDKSMFSHSYICQNPKCGRTVWVRPANAHEVKYCKPCKKNHE